MPEAPQTLREQLLRDEGVRLKVYTDSVGKATIGCGRNLVDVGVSLEEAEILLDNDIRRATASVIADLPWAARIDGVRRDALVNLCFNVGIKGLLGFKKMLAAAEQGQWATAAAELLDSKYRRQVGVRAERLAQQLETGERV